MDDNHMMSFCCAREVSAVAYLDAFDASLDETLKECRIGLLEVQLGVDIAPDRLVVTRLLPRVAHLSNASLLGHFQVSEDHRQQLGIECCDWRRGSVVPDDWRTAADALWRMGFLLRDLQVEGRAARRGVHGDSHGLTRVSRAQGQGPSSCRGRTASWHARRSVLCGKNARAWNTTQHTASRGCDSEVLGVREARQLTASGSRHSQLMCTRWQAGLQA